MPHHHRPEAIQRCQVLKSGIDSTPASPGQLGRGVGYGEESVRTFFCLSGGRSGIRSWARSVPGRAARPGCGDSFGGVIFFLKTDVKIAAALSLVREHRDLLIIPANNVVPFKKAQHPVVSGLLVIIDQRVIVALGTPKVASATRGVDVASRQQVGIRQAIEV